MSGFDIRLMFTLPPRDSPLQYKRCVHLWNNFPCITTFVEPLSLVHWFKMKRNDSTQSLTIAGYSLILVSDRFNSKSSNIKG